MKGLAVTIGWMIRDTFRQSLASGIFWVLLTVSLISILVCTSVSVVGSTSLAAPGEQPEFLNPEDPDAKIAKEDGVAVISGQLMLGFGALEVPLARDARSAVYALELILAGGVADTAGLLLALVWTAGFLPAFLDRRNISVLLAKPAPRWCLLAGKYCGVLAFVLVQSIFFVVGTWLALGCRTGVWDASYLLTIPLLLLHFAIFFSFSMLLAVVTRSTVVCVFGSIVFWLMCWGMNYGRHMLAMGDKVAGDSKFSNSVMWMADIGYWILPKPGDLSMLLFDALDASQYFRSALDMHAVANAGFFSLWLSVLTSLAFTAYMLVAAARQFATTDY
jgi:ABC-type transport system involved in multi-copper enzyme maturation permease subunit